MTILVVDDDAHMVRSVQKNIAWDALDIDTVYTANSVHQAQAVLESCKVDVMLCDIEMPQGSGLDLLEWVREHGMDVEALFLTSYANFDYAQRAISLSSIEYFLKPVDYEKLTEGLKRALVKVRQKQPNQQTALQGDPWQQSRLDAFSGFWSRVGNGQYKGDAIASIEDMKAYVRHLTGAPALTPQREASVVNQLLDFIDQNFQKEINRAELAGMVYLNPDYVSRLFKKEVGESIGGYILSKRMIQAKTLLRDSTIPIHEVSALVGYDSFAYFSKLFKKHEGMSPSEFRRKARRTR